MLLRRFNGRDMSHIVVRRSVARSAFSGGYLSKGLHGSSSQRIATLAFALRIQLHSLCPRMCICEEAFKTMSIIFPYLGCHFEHPRRCALSRNSSLARDVVSSPLCRRYVEDCTEHIAARYTVRHKQKQRQPQKGVWRRQGRSTAQLRL